ncbi:MAG TPA: hypothetical protein DC034_03560 [Clostridium sp.]|jgi:hypothetical protein|uniref:ABC transporter permease n=1 Tax=Clostridium lapidicellarium TaxID=3240931 RepID=A0ABV4DWW8_9CLOT|nr:hypothetical protein [Clostridiales bacterium]HBC95859.1 hypothetical protein [Clostridium sp.]
MIFFLYLSGFLALSLGIKLFYKQGKRISNKNYSERELLQYWTKNMISNITAMCITALFVLFIIPPLIWMSAPKETSITNKVLETKNLVPISSSGKNSYVREVKNKNSKTCIINTGDNENRDLQSFNSKSVEIIPTANENPKYEKIAEYRMKKLKGSWIIPNSINDIYANIYTNYGQKNFIKDKVRLIVPPGSKQ